jgi:lipid-A-disaccharide synthase
LIRALRQREPGLECVGYGGPRMAAAGCQLHADLTELAVMWVWQVLLNLHRFWRLYRQARRYFRDQRPDAVVLIDYPGFNWWIARAAKRCGIPVFYYGVPQMWAWAGWRVRKMRRLVDHVLCKLPFEAAWYEQRRCRATYVGHPYFDQLASQTLDREFLSAMDQHPTPLVSILPGSRTQEVLKNLPQFLRAAGDVGRRLPQVRWAIASFNEKQAELARRLVAAAGLPIEVYVGRTAELIALSRCCLACSGSVSLELLHAAKPSVVLYCVERWGYELATRFFLKVKYITLVNLLAADDPFLARGQRYDSAGACARDVPLPEYLTWRDVSGALADQLIVWLSDVEEHARSRARLTAVKQQYAATGASATAAAYVLDALRRRRDRAPSLDDDSSSRNAHGSRAA